MHVICLFSAIDPKPEKYCNRKHFYSINCVVICDHLKRVRFFTNRHCGSAHDSRIWEETHLKSRLATRFSPHQLQHLIGDEGFACSDTLLTIVREHQLNRITGVILIHYLTISLKQMHFGAICEKQMYYQ
jgi:hypothetical protein